MIDLAATFPPGRDASAVGVLLKQFLVQYSVGKYPVHEAVFDLQRLKRTVRKGADLDFRLPTGECPLHLAAQCGLDEAVKVLLESGAEVNARNQEQSAPLHFAIYPILSPLEVYDASPEASFRCSCILLANGARIDSGNKHGITPLVLAIKTRNDAIIGLLLDNGADLNVVDRGGWTPLHHACFAANSRYVESLLDRGADPTALSKSGETPMDVVNQLDHDFEKERGVIRQLLAASFE